MSNFTPPASAVRQPTEAAGLDGNGRKTHDIIYKGPYDALESASASIVVGTCIAAGSYALEWRLEHAPGCGLLTITCAATDPNSTATASLATCTDDLWEVRSIRNDVSIFVYCGDSNTNPNRAKIEAWQREPDGELAAQYKFRNSAGVEVALGAEDVMVAKKIAKGCESVVRFYAAITRTRTYDGPPPACLQDLSTIGDPPYATNTRSPDGVASAIAAHEWLKMQDDAVGQPDKTWKRIESWWGIPKTDAPDSHPWDPDFYGPNRWSAPLIV